MTFKSAKSCTPCRCILLNASVCGYGKVCASALRGSGARMLFAESEHEGGVQVDTIMSDIDIFVSSIGAEVSWHSPNGMRCQMCLFRRTVTMASPTTM